jgi:hypothetical protein
MREAFRDKNFRREALELISTCNEIVDIYVAQGLRLTLRQLYYQLVVKGIIENNERQYSRLSEILSSARLAGLVDWDAIEDRVRRPHKRSEFSDMKDLVEAAIASYRLPRWKGQKCYTELWVEKDALAGVLRPIADKFHITLMVNRGYSSQSAMYESAQRIRSKVEEYGCDESIILYLGDLDPSGEDMVRDIQDRMKMFGVEVPVVKLALNMGQVKKFNPPPNPAKMTDPRSQAFIEKFGGSSWEVDALPPEVLTQIITGVLNKLVDREKMQVILDKEEQDKKWLLDKVSRKWGR